MEDFDSVHNVDRRKPRKIMKVQPSKYEVTEAVHATKKYWNSVFNAIDSTVTKEEKESKLLAEALPADLYEKVCSTLDIPIISRVEHRDEKIKGAIPRRLLKKPMLSFRTCLHIDRELDSDTDVELFDSVKLYSLDEVNHLIDVTNVNDAEDEKPNIYQEFLSKPEREQVTWPTHYLQPEKEDEKSLIKKADDLTDRIATEFCQYMKELGGDQQSQLFTPKAIKELFQIEFDTHVARSLSVVVKELPSVEEKVANVTGNPEKSRYAALEREISKDIKAERKPDRIRAFGSSLSLHDQYRASRNNTRKLWRSARHVPKDLVTLKTVWEGITNLRSVKEYCRWMIDHPEHRKPPYLCSLGMFDASVLDTKQSFEANKYTAATAAVSSADEGPAPIDDIRRRLSQLADSS